ncbi:MAG: right-handed parallel beta-helix repeat-containing protein [Candidatus Hodarchaeales archaeon]|jgi:parallel beta-helix repeat protein
MLKFTRCFRVYLIITLTLVAFRFAFNQTMAPIVADATVTGTPLPSGYNDWVITQNTTAQDEVIILNGSVYIYGPYNLTLRNVTLKFNCTSNGEHVLEVRDGGGLYMDNCTITAYDPPNAWWLNAKEGSTISLNDSTFSYAGPDSGRPGVRIKSNNANITYCSFENSFSGPYIVYADNVRLSHCRIAKSTSYGIFLESSENSTIVDNTVIESGWGAGIHIAHSPNCIVNGNIITDNNRNGIELTYSGNSTVSGNAVTNISGSGIQFSNSNCSTIGGNTITNSGGVSLSRCNNSLVSNITITNNASTGINLYRISNVTVSDITITAFLEVVTSR